MIMDWHAFDFEVVSGQVLETGPLEHRAGRFICIGK